MIPKSVIHLLSGGMDSTVLLYDLIEQGCSVHAVLFNYGQKHSQELEWAKYHCHLTRTMFSTVDLPRLKGSILTDGSGTEVVPGRNLVFISAAVNLAASAGAECVTIGCNRDDAEMFPDCRKEFMHSTNQTLSSAEINIEVCAPYIAKRKWEIAAMAREMGIAIESTWSCYSGGLSPCGTCKACVLREEAISK